MKRWPVRLTLDLPRLTAEQAVVLSECLVELAMVVSDMHDAALRDAAAEEGLRELEIQLLEEEHDRAPELLDTEAEIPF